MNLIVQVLEVTTKNETIQLCAGEDFIINNRVYNQTGSYQEIFTASSGCDSIINFTIQVFESSVTNQTIRLCEGENFVINNQAYNQAGVFQEILTAINGCDSIVNFDIILIPAIITSVSQRICEGTTLQFGGFEYTLPGTYTLAGKSVITGCDSTTILELIPYSSGVTITAVSYTHLTLPTKA